MKNLLIYLIVLVLTVSLTAKNVEVTNDSDSQEKVITRVLDKPINLVAKTASANSSTVNLSWSMPDTTVGIASWTDDFNSTEYNNHNFKTGWTVVQGNGFSYDTEGSDPEVGYWFRTYYHSNPYHPWWGNGNTTVPSNSTGNGHARVNWGNNINTYLVTPSIAVQTGTKVTFDWAGSYDNCVPVNAGNFMVDVSEDGGLNWTTVWHWDNIPQWSMWYPVLETTVSLSSYAGKSVKVAFHYQQNDGAYLLMDNVAVGVSSKPVGTTVIWSGDKNATNVSIPANQGLIFENNRNLVAPKINTNKTAGLTGFKLYRDNALIQEITNSSTRTFADFDVTDGTHFYYIKAVYGSQMSESSDPAQVIVDTKNKWFYYGDTTKYTQHFSRNMQEAWSAAVDFDLPANNNKGYYAKKIVTATYTALNVGWKIVPFDTTPGSTPIGTLSGTINTTEHSWNNIFVTYYDSHTDIVDFTKLQGHVAVVLDLPAIPPSETTQNALNCQEMNSLGSPDGQHAWYQATPSEPWMKLDYLGLGAWNIRLLVQDLNGITQEILPGRTDLAQNYPNPFNPNTTISFYNPVGGNVDLSVYNAKGEFVTNLIKNSNMKAGHQSVNFNATGLNSGVYYYTLKTEAKTITKKMLLVK